VKYWRHLVLIIGLAFSVGSFANPSASDAEFEVRAREIGRSLRCVVCQNQSIEDSDAVLAEDMRTLVRSRLRAGDSDEQVIEFMHKRYGDFVLLKPRIQPSTYPLWFAPAFLTIGFLTWFVLRGRKKPATVQSELTPLNEDEKQRLASLMGPEE